MTDDPKSPRFPHDQEARDARKRAKIGEAATRRLAEHDDDMRVRLFTRAKMLSWRLGFGGAAGKREANEILSDVFLTILGWARAGRDLDAIGDGLIIQVIKQRTLDHIRRAARRKERPLSDVGKAVNEGKPQSPPTVPIDPRDPKKSAELHDDLERVRTSIGEEKWAMIELLGAGAGHREIADWLQIKPAAARKRISRVRLEAQQLLS